MLAATGPVSRVGGAALEFRISSTAPMVWECLQSPAKHARDAQGRLSLRGFASRRLCVEVRLCSSGFGIFLLQRNAETAKESNYVNNCELHPAIAQIGAVERGFSRKAAGNWGGGAAPPDRVLVVACSAGPGR